jgi:putative heme-binding domain-containing protein
VTRLAAPWIWIWIGLGLGLIPLAAPAPALAQRDLRELPDPDPDVERRSFQVAEGFEVNLFAAEPMIAKPIQMNWDAQGRLWVASSEVYPQLAPGQVANDKVLVLEDTDGDGRADRSTVFADGLLIPTGIEPGDGGAYVANATELLHLADTDGDGRADRGRVLLTGFGTEDTHHILHTFRRGPEGRLYFNQSIYIHSHIETPWGVRRLNGGGIWRFEPASRQLDVTLRGLINPWGHAFDRWGRRFATDGAGSEGINDVVVGASYPTAPDAARILHGLNPGSPKHCGLEFLSGRHLPESWRGSLLTNDFRANRVCRFVLGEDGSSYTSREQPELIKTSHVAFRPVDVKMGPDGAIYIADWYNPIIQHGEVDFRDPRRDHVRGRIWRVTARNRPLVPRPTLVGASVAALLEHLKAPEDWTRHFAKRVLIETHGRSIVADLETWVRSLDSRDPEREHHRLEALWLYQGLGVIEPELLKALLKSPDPRARMASASIVADWREGLDDPASLLEPLVRDEHPRVRLEAVRALARIPGARSAAIALRALDEPVDGNLDYGLWLTARDLEDSWLPETRAGRFDFGGRVDHLLFALRSVGSPEVLPPLLEALRNGKIPAENEQGALTLIASLGGPRELGLIFDLATGAGDRPPERRAALLEALLEAHRRRQIRPETNLEPLRGTLSAAETPLRAVSARLVGAYRLDGFRNALHDRARDAEEPLETRRAAIEGLAGLGQPEDRAFLEALATSQWPRPVRMAAVTALLPLDPVAAARGAVGVLETAEADSDPREMLAVFRDRREAAAPLAKALEGRAIPPDVAKLGIRVLGGSGRANPELLAALNRAGGLTSAPPPPSGEALEALLADIGRLGDPDRGERVFRRPELACWNCHALGGAGGRVGPDLSSIGASAPLDYLVDSLYQPGKAIKEGYHALVVATSDGKVVSGIKVREGDGELVLRDADDRDVVVFAGAIEETKPGGSLMPAGLIDSLTRAEVVDLLRFLSALGKPGPHALGQARLFRRWEVLDATRENSFALRRTRFDTAADPSASLGWSPRYSTVAGDLPLDEIPTMQPRPGEAVAGFARTQLDVSTAGAVRLRVTDPRGLSLWVDGQPNELREETTLDLSAGRHTLTFAIDPAQRSSPLRVELLDLAGSPARAAVVLGK